MSAQSPRPTDSDGSTRREFLERTGATAGGLAVLGAGGSQIAPQFSPVGRAEAIAPAAVAAYVGAGMVLGWATREAEIIGSDDPPEGLTPEALEMHVYEMARTRESNNASTFIDNKNIVDSGLENAAYADGKIGAVEALNEQETQENVLNAGLAELDEYESVVLSNFIKSWNESALEFETLYNRVTDHDGIDDDEFSNFHGYVYETANGGYSHSGPVLEESEFELPNGEMIDFYYVRQARADDFYGLWAFHETDFSSDDRADQLAAYPGEVEWNTEHGTVTYLRAPDWNEVYDIITGTFDDVRAGLETWVDGVYGEVQAGTLDTSELLTPREMAEMTADEENFNQALADLMALNVAVDLEREATITLERDTDTVTLRGALAVSRDPGEPLEAGNTYDPDDLPGEIDYDIYFNYDVSQGEGEWLAFEEGIDGGWLTFTAEPLPETQYRITTTAGEQVVLTGEDFEPDDEDNPTAWEVDLTDELDDQITNVEQVEMFSESGETRYETIQLREPFTLESFEDSDGNEHDTANFTRDEPQDDENYITEEEWKELQRRNEELIKKYEEAKNDDGISIPSLDNLASEYGGAFAGVIIVVVAISAVVGFVTDSIPGLGGN